MKDGWKIRKSSRHTTFRISCIVHWRREKYRELYADGQSPQECIRKGGQMIDLSVHPNAHLLHGLAVHAFQDVHFICGDSTLSIPCKPSAFHQVGKPSSSLIYVVIVANCQFSSCLSPSFRLGRQSYGHLITALQVFRKKSPHSFRGSISH